MTQPSPRPQTIVCEHISGLPLCDSYDSRIPWVTRQLGYETPARTPDCVGIREGRNKSSCTREGEITYLRIRIQPSEPLAKTGSNMTSMCWVGDRGVLLTLARSWSSAQNQWIMSATRYMSNLRKGRSIS